MDWRSLCLFVQLRQLNSCAPLVGEQQSRKIRVHCAQTILHPQTTFPQPPSLFLECWTQNLAPTYVLSTIYTEYFSDKGKKSDTLESQLEDAMEVDLVNVREKREAEKQGNRDAIHSWHSPFKIYSERHRRRIDLSRSCLGQKDTADVGRTIRDYRRWCHCTNQEILQIFVARNREYATQLGTLLFVA